MNFLRRATPAVLVLAASLHVFAQPAAEGLTPEDSIRLGQCQDNLKPAVLLPDTARACAEFLKADGGRVLESMKRADSAATAEFLGKTAALANLSDLVSDSSIGCHELRDSLRLILPCDDTLLCKLGLGPEPDKVLAWTERLSVDDPRFSASRRSEIAEAILYWESLVEAFRSGRDREKWRQLDIQGRMKAYRAWLRVQCVEPGFETEEAKRLLQDMEREIPGEFRDCAERPRALGRRPGSGGTTPSPLPGMFKPEEAQPIAEALKAPLAEELRGTIVGRKLLEFFEGPRVKDPKGRVLNEMNLAFQRFDDPGFMGLWDAGRINFSLGYLEGWMKKSNLTREGLLADRNSLAALARAIAPVLVHEGTHQTQDAFFALNGIPDYLINVEEEVGAAVNAALFVEENLQKWGAGYLQNLSELDNRLHRSLKKMGIEGIRADREYTYLNLKLGSKFSLQMNTAKAFGKEQAQIDYRFLAGVPKGSTPHRKVSREVSDKLDKYGLLMKKYEQDEDWFYWVQEQLNKSARVEKQ